jgi:hypothetical protein
MNIHSIQAIQFLQNAIGFPEKGDNQANTKSGSSGAQVTTEINPPRVSPQGISAMINYIQEQLKSLLESYPPFFPAGSPQRIDLIKKVKGLEEQIGHSSVDTHLKKALAENPLPEQATDQDISAALDRLFSLRDRLQKKSPVSGTPVKPGTILNLKV